MSLTILNQYPVCCFWDMDDQLKGPPFLAMDRTMEILTSDHWPTVSSLCYKKLSATYLTVQSGPFHYTKVPFPAIPPIPAGVEGLVSIFSMYLIFWSYFETQVWLTSGCLVSIAAVFGFRRLSLSCFQVCWIIAGIVCLTLTIWYWYKKFSFFLWN